MSDLTACHLCSTLVGCNPPMKNNQPTCTRCARAFDAGLQTGRRQGLNDAQAQVRDGYDNGYQAGRAEGAAAARRANTLEAALRNAKSSLVYWMEKCRTAAGYSSVGDTALADIDAALSPAPAKQHA